MIERGQIRWITLNPNREPGRYTITQNRPAVIVNAKIDEHIPTYEVVFLTTRPKRDMETHTTIESTGRESTALCEQISCVSQEQVGEYIANVTDDEMGRIEECMCRSLGIRLDGDAMVWKAKYETVLDLYREAIHVR